MLFAVFLLPSVLFWGSGVLKEGLIFFTLGLLIYYSDKLFSLKSILICLAAAALLAFSKFYVWLAILPSLVLLIWTNKTSSSKTFVKYVCIVLFIGAVGLNIDSFTNIQNPLVTLSQKQYEFNQLAYGQLTDSNNKPIAVANSLIELNKLEPTFYSFLVNAHQALINTTLRPYLWELKSPMILLAGLETAAFIIIFFLLLFFIKPLKEIKWKYVLFCFSFVLIQFLIIGETTPILGAIARYKTTALPFLAIGLIFILDKEKLIKKVPFFKKILN